MCKLDTEDVIAEPGYWPNVTASPANMANWWWLLVAAEVTTPPRNVCTAICRCRIICSFLALSRLYMGPNLFLPPRILSARTAVTKTQSHIIRLNVKTTIIIVTLHIPKHYYQRQTGLLFYEDIGPKS